ncbi:MAG TPA: FAD-dependent oxidoreductase [Gaiellaceae bacterium]|nr:FAD-dependent oxidoreductase [Gaiellaceae bacterium]
MKAVVAGGGFAGLAAALALARAGHEVTLLERDVVSADVAPQDAFAVDRRGIPHFFQPHAFLPRGRRELLLLAPDVLDSLLSAGAEPQDLSTKLRGPRDPGDDELVFVWARRPLIEWALRRAVAAEPAVELRQGTTVAGLVVEGARATGVAVAGGDVVRADLVVDALGRYRPPRGWHRPVGAEAECGALYYCRYFRLRDGVEHMEPIGGTPLNPRGDLGYMGFNTFRGDNRTYSIIFLVPTFDRELRALRDETAWMAAARTMSPLDTMTSPDYGEPITDVMPMGGLLNVDRTTEPAASGVAAVGDAFCHTDPAFAWGLSFSLAHARAVAEATEDATDGADAAARYRDAVAAEARERFALAVATDDARTRRWQGEPLDFTRRDGSYPLFSFAAALAAASHDDLVLRRTIRRIGALDRTAVFDGDDEVQTRIEQIVGRLFGDGAPPPAGPPRDELLRLIATS